jgi:hypothetical protein
MRRPPVAGSAAPVRAEQDTGSAVFSVAVYFAFVKALPAHPVRVPLIFIVWTVGVSVKPGESVTFPVLPVHVARATTV